MLPPPKLCTAGSRTLRNRLTFIRTYIFWMIREGHQQVVFLDPHGLAHDTDKDREKQNLCKNIRKEYEPFIQSRLKEKGIPTEILLDAYNIYSNSRLF
ncbi:hypothetical protein ACKUB1_11790 [Methanospirillum stamsii]|nr:hypothetical protein [Methanospirillum stamsii]